MTKQRVILEQRHWSPDDLEVIKGMMDRLEWTEAERTLRYYLNDRPDDFRAQFLLGRLYLSTDRYAEGRLCYQYLRDRFPNRIDVAMNLAKAHDYLLDWERSEALYHEILDKDPDNIKAMNHLGSIAVQWPRLPKLIENVNQSAVPFAIMPDSLKRRLHVEAQIAQFLDDVLSVQRLPIEDMLTHRVE